MGLDSLFLDAHRRVGIAESKGEYAVSIWTGLGYPSEFKNAKEFFRPVHGETPRIMGWYEFTDAGRAEYLKRFKGQPKWVDHSQGGKLYA